MKVVLAFLALVALLLTFATASPFDVVHDQGTLLGRAGTKYVGSTCKSSAECYSANCVNVTASTPGTCQRQVTGGVCFENANCATFNCNNQKCSTPSKLKGVCSSKSDCDQGRYCGEGVCRALIAPNQRCNDTSQCAAGECSPYSCRNTNGAPINCPGEPDPVNGYFTRFSFCGRYSTGHTCANTGECEIGYCGNGKCAENGEGALCDVSSQCTSPGAICIQGRCSTPGNNTLYPEERCGLDAQCRSKSCRSSLRNRDDEGVNDGSASFYGRKRYAVPGEYSLCNYMQEGESCRTYFNCEYTLCKNSTCTCGAPGDRCSINYQCASGACGYDGKCLDAKKGSKNPQGTPCGNNNQCLSNRCLYRQLYGVKRPSQVIQGLEVEKRDTVCYQALIGGACRNNAGCAKGTCVNGVCTKVSSTTSSTASRLPPPYVGLATSITTSSTTPSRSAISPLSPSSWRPSAGLHTSSKSHLGRQETPFGSKVSRVLFLRVIAPTLMDIRSPFTSHVRPQSVSDYWI
ncbi:hypothetical protein V8E36_002266 [Tilletia maclaganii]